MTPLILTVAPNGAYKQASDHPAVPVTAAQLARDAKTCLDAGAAMLHLHIRDARGHHSLDVAGYREALRVVHSAVGTALVLQVTSEAAKVYCAPAQIAMVRALRPEAVSVALRELDQPEIGAAGLADFFGWLARERVMTQVILYDSADLARWQALRADGTVPDAPWFLLFVLGRYSVGQVSSPLDLLPFVAAHRGRLTQTLFHWANRVTYLFSRSEIPREEFQAFERQLTEGLHRVQGDKKRLTFTVLYTCADWGLCMTTLFCAFKAVDVQLPVGHLSAGFTAGMASTLIPILPGGLGVLEGSMTAVFQSLGIDWDKAFVAVLLYRLAYYLVPGLASVLVLWGLKVSEPNLLDDVKS